MVHYQYFILPETPLTNQVINQSPDITLYDELLRLYALDKKELQKMFELKFDLQGTGGRASNQPIDFSVHRRLGNDGVIKKLTREQVEALLRNVLALKPKYLQVAGLVKIKNRS